MNVADLVRAPDISGDIQLGLVMEAEHCSSTGVLGHWVEYFEDRYTWKWFGPDDVHMVEVISEAR